MKLNTSEWRTLCWVLETRAYKYSDINDITSTEYKMFRSIFNRVSASADNSVLRFTDEQKRYIMAMLDDYIAFNLQAIPNVVAQRDCENIRRRLVVK